MGASAVQHPGVPEQRSIRSVGIHLLGLPLALEENVASEHVTRLLAVAARAVDELRRLDPPAERGTITVADVVAARTAAEHVDRVWARAKDVWRAWSEHHATVRGRSAQIMRFA